MTAPVRSLPLRRLVRGPAPDRSRVLYTDIWFRGHVNQRYAELLPRLERVDPYLIHCSDRRLLRGVQQRALKATRRARYKLLLGAAGGRYASLWLGDRRQIPYYQGRILADCDDPKFTTEELELLNRPNVAAAVVVNERVAQRFAELGLRKPCHVIPHGVSVGAIDDRAVAEVRGQHRDDGEVVVGYMAAWLLSQGDRRGDDSLHNVDHLLELWDEIRGRIPNGRLWLIGGASDRIRRRCAGRADIKLFGRIPRERMLAHVANFDIALYPRTEDKGYQASKVVEYMGCGVPIVSYDYEVTADIREAGAGLLASTPREFVDAVERLTRDERLRSELATAARTAGVARDWDELASRYSGLMARYL